MRSQVTRSKLSATEARNLRTLLLLNVFAPEEIGSRIAQARTEAGMRQEDLADLIGISTRQMQNLESGESKPYKHLQSIASATNRSFDWFLHGSEDGDATSPLQDTLAEMVAALGSVSQKLDRVLRELQQAQQDD